MTIDALPPAPVPTDSAAAFDAKAFAFAAALDLFGTQANALGANAQTNSDIAVSLLLGMALPTYGDTSSTSLTIGTGTKVFTTSTGKAWVAGQTVVASNGANFMKGLVTSYSGSTLTVNVATVNGSGTFASWAIGLSCNEAAARLATGAAALTVPYAFEAYRSTNQTSGAVTLFDTIVNQSGSGYSAPTGLFTAPVTGWYSFAASLNIYQNIIGGFRYRASLVKSGVGIAYSDFNDPVQGSSGAISLCAITRMTAGETMSVTPYVPWAANIYLIAGTSSRFSGTFLGT